MVYVWIDDIRRPPSKLEVRGVELASSFDEAINIFLNLKSNEIVYIDFDHDLGRHKTGYDIAKWLIANNITGFFHIHSMNPVGANNIRALLKHYGWIEDFNL